MKKLLYLYAAIAALVLAASCSRETASPEIIPEPEGPEVIFDIQGEVDGGAGKTGITERTVTDETGTHTYQDPWWSHGDMLSVIIDSFSQTDGDGKESAKTKVDASIENVAEEGSTICDFSGTFKLNNSTEPTGTGFVYSFYPSGALATEVSDRISPDGKKIKANIKTTQCPPAAGTFDPDADLLIGLPTTYEYRNDENGRYFHADIRFARVISLLRVNLKPASSDPCPDGLKVTKFRMDATTGLTGRTWLILDILQNKQQSAFGDWLNQEKFVSATYDGEFKPEINGTGNSNSIFLCVRPGTLAKNSILKFTLEAVNEDGDIYDIVKEVTLPSAIDLPQGQMANPIALSIGASHCTKRAPETRLLYEDFHGVTVNETQAQPDLTGAFGIGVNENLKYEYSSTNTNIRNTNAQETGNFNLYLPADQSFTILNIANVNVDRSFTLSAKVRTPNYATVSYRESGSEDWTEAGQIGHGQTSWGGGAVCQVDFSFDVAPEAFDVMITAPAAMSLDDIGIAPSSLSVDKTEIVLGAEKDATDTFTVECAYAWTSSLSQGAGFSIAPDSASAPAEGEKSSTLVTVTASSEGSTSEETVLGTITITDGHSAPCVITVKQERKKESNVDVINLDFTGVSKYAEWSNTGNTGVVYSGYSGKGNSGATNAIALNTTKYDTPPYHSGIFVSSNEKHLLAHSITFKWNSATTDTRRIDVYGKNTAYSSPDDFWDNDLKGTLIGSLTCGSEVLELGDSYKYIAFRSNSGALYLDEIDIEWVKAEDVVRVLDEFELEPGYKDDTSISVSWSLVDHATGYSCTLRQGETTVSGPVTPSIDGNKASVTFDGLTPETVYNVKVSASDNSGLYESTTSELAVSTCFREVLDINQFKDLSASSYNTETANFTKNGISYDYQFFRVNPMNTPSGWAAKQLIQLGKEASKKGVICNTIANRIISIRIVAAEEFSSPFNLYYGEGSIGSTSTDMRNKKLETTETVTYKKADNEDATAELPVYEINLSSANATVFQLLNGSGTCLIHHIEIVYESCLHHDDTEEGGTEIVIPASTTWLDSIEIPAASVSDYTPGENYRDLYGHWTVDEAFEDSPKTKGIGFYTTDQNQQIAVHTFPYNGEVLTNYSLLYDKNKCAALWVAYKRNADVYPNNSVGRHDRFGTEDPVIPSDWQPNLNAAYTAGAVSYARGHQVASNDCQTTLHQEKQSFYTTNMTPQYSSLNTGKWSSIEGKVQKIAAETSGRDTLYVVTGPLFEETISYTTDKDGKQCAIPTGYYKCVMKCSFSSPGTVTGAKGCAYLVDTNSTNPDSYTVTSIDAIEARTGFDFFPRVPDAYETAAEAQTSSL